MEKYEEELNGKRILIVDDEEDILASLRELLEMCEIETAGGFDEAINLLDSRDYDAAILDIMGVRGYDLLEVTAEKGIPTLMLTANALSSDDFVRSIRTGARAYVPKDRISEIPLFLMDVLQEAAGRGRRKRWFERLEAFFEETFGQGWREKEDPEFWKRHFYI